MQTWIGQPANECEVDKDITLVAGPGTDWFRDPRSGTVTANAPVLVVAEGRSPVTVSCRVGVELRHTFDAAALLVHHDDAHWTKFAACQGEASSRPASSSRPSPARPGRPAGRPVATSSRSATGPRISTPPSPPVQAASVAVSVMPAKRLRAP